MTRSQLLLVAAAWTANAMASASAQARGIVRNSPRPEPGRAAVCGRASGYCTLGYSNQVLGTTDVPTVEGLLGRKFHGLRQNQAYTTTGWATAGTEYDAGRTKTYRSVQVDTLPGGWAAVTAGDADANLTTIATNLMALSSKFNPANPALVCFSHETSIDSTPLGGTLGTAQQFIDAYRHVRDLWDAMGATVRSKTGAWKGGPIEMCYVGWDRMFVSIDGTGPPTAGQGIDDFDPDRGSSPAPAGTSYYEYIGSDVYNSVNSPGVLKYSTDATLLLAPIYRAAVARNKQWMMGEMACEDGSTTADHVNKALWLDGLRRYVVSCGKNRPGSCIALMSTIKTDASLYNVDSSPESLQAWQLIAKDSFFG